VGTIGLEKENLYYGLVVSDTETGLMWAATENGIPINWSDALSYCQNFSSGGHTDWRMINLNGFNMIW
jgi:hypothetical protein